VATFAARARFDGGCWLLLQFVIFVVSNYAAVIGFFMWKSKRAEAAEAARAPPPSYPDFAKGEFGIGVLRAPVVA